MTQLEAGVIGFISGLIVGTFLAVFVIGWVIVVSGFANPPKFYSDIHSDVMSNQYEPHSNAFTIGFVVGFLSGVSSASVAFDSQNE